MRPASCSAIANAGAASGVVTHVERIRDAVSLYAALVAEQSGSESIVVTRALNISLGEAGRLLGVDLLAQLHSSRANVDAALAESVTATPATTATGLAKLRARIDAGTATETEVRAFFVAAIGVTDSSRRDQRDQLTAAANDAVISSGLRRALAGLTDAVDTFIAGAQAGTAAAALSIAGLPGASTGITDLAAADAVYASVSARLPSELTGRARAAWEELIVNDPEVRTFQQFLAALVQGQVQNPADASLENLGDTFRRGLMFQDHLGKVVDATAADIVPLAKKVRNDATKELERYFLALAVIAAFSAALAFAITRNTVRPLRRLAARASDVSAGEIDGEPLAPRGPYEVASVTETFNEIVANLAKLDATTLALATADLDNPVLTTPVPGRIGDSLRHSIVTLQESIRENQSLQLELERNEARFRELADRSPDIILRFVLEPAPHFEYVSPSFEILTGLSVAAVEADPTAILGGLEQGARDLLAEGAAGRPLPPVFDVRFRRTDGSVIVFEMRIVVTPGGLQGVGRDVTEIRVLQALLAEQAARDPLTGLANRRLLDELLARALARSARTGTVLTVAFIDLDSFKSVNDTYGHDAGDTVLRVTAERLRTAVRGADVIARYGGDEFVVVSEGAPGDSATTLARRIEHALRPPVDIGDGVLVLCAPSIGIADTGETRDAAGLVTAADHAMLEMKRLRRTFRPAGTEPVRSGQTLRR